jgi:hypothetical protein
VQAEGEGGGVGKSSKEEAAEAPQEDSMKNSAGGRWGRFSWVQHSKDQCALDVEEESWISGMRISRLTLDASATTKAGCERVISAFASS